MEEVKNPRSGESSSHQQSEASRIVDDADKFRHFLRVLKTSEKIEGKDGYKILKIIRDENRPEGFKNISEGNVHFKTQHSQERSILFSLLKNI